MEFIWIIAPLVGGFLILAVLCVLPFLLGYAFDEDGLTPDGEFGMKMGLTLLAIAVFLVYCIIRDN